ncbi:MAG TPA: class I SAM-dependent methyltransferase [Chloroflexota bacterium]|nr:class I SAM-dependent methyltransferase [Chloroflexota bacterium]
MRRGSLTVRYARACSLNRAGQESGTLLARARKTAAWWDDFWRHRPAAHGRSVTCRRTAEEALSLLAPEVERLSPRVSRASGSGSRLRVLDLGCGDGEITELLLANPRLDLVAIDLSAEALGQFRRRLRGHPGRPPPLLRASVYELPFSDAAFDAVVSFGYASAASYSGAQLELARVLRPGGVALVDFANPSLYHWLAEARGTLRWYRRYRRPSDGLYHFGRRGLAAHFHSADLALEAVRYLNAYPPLGAAVDSPGWVALDRLLASLLGPMLGRVLLAKLRRRDDSQCDRLRAL